MEETCSVLKGNWAKLSWWLKCQMKQNLCEYSAVGDDRDLARLKGNRGYSLATEMTKMCSTDTFYYSGLPTPKEQPTIHSVMHPTNKPFIYPSIQPSSHSFIHWAFIGHLLCQSPYQLLGLQKQIRNNPCSEETLHLGKCLILYTPLYTLSY